MEEIVKLILDMSDKHNISVHEISLSLNQMSSNDFIEVWQFQETAINKQDMWRLLETKKINNK